MNYESLLNIPYKTFRIFLVIIFGILITFLIIVNFQVYDVYNTYAYYEDMTLVLNIPLQYSDTLLNAEYFKIDDQKYDLNILYVSNILLDSTTQSNYQEVIIESSNTYTENMVLNLSIYYNKEKVLNKIKKLL